MKLQDSRRGCIISEGLDCLALGLVYGNDVIASHILHKAVGVGQEGVSCCCCEACHQLQGIHISLSHCECDDSACIRWRGGSSGESQFLCCISVVSSVLEGYLSDVK